MAFLIRRAVVIANPASRNGRRLAERARRAFTRRNVDVDLIFTERPGHGAELAHHNHEQYDAVFALGGDGTVMEIAGALAGTQTKIGILPGGTGNLLARALGIPLNVRRAVDQLLDGDEHLIDLGRFPSGKRFAIAAGVGVDAMMIAETPPWFKQQFGVLAYTLMGTRAMLRSVVKKQYFGVRVEVDGVSYERRVVAIMIANFGDVLGQRITLGPNISADDGVLDACVFCPGGLRDAIRVAGRLLRGDFGNDPCLLYVSGKQFRVETTPTMQWQADGELMGTTPFEVVVEPRSVRLLVPPRHGTLSSHS